MKTEDLAREVLSKLTDEGRTLATAESCTGGLLGKLLTDIPGASNAYKGGVISYVSEVKHRLLGVEQETLDICTAVSRETAHEMAKGAREAVKADVGVSTTGSPVRTETKQGGPSALSTLRSTWRAFRIAASSISRAAARRSARRPHTRHFRCCWSFYNRIDFEPDRRLSGSFLRPVQIVLNKS